MRTLGDLLNEGSGKLLAAGIQDARLDAGYLLEYSLGITKTEYLIHPEKMVSVQQDKAYMETIEKRCQRIPLQYITGQQEFMGLPFEVNRDVLIPRQDTEVLAEQVLKHINTMEKNGLAPEVLDMCTGSGCILISLAKLGKLGKAEGADISWKALKVAERNGKANGVSAVWIQSDLFQHINGMYDIIVSNPPYIESGEIPGLMPEVKLFEPKLALDGDQDGLYFYRQIIRKARDYLKESGTLFFEIGYNQGEKVSKLMKQAGFTDIQIKKDLSGLDRVIWGTGGLGELRGTGGFVG